MAKLHHIHAWQKVSSSLKFRVVQTQVAFVWHSAEIRFICCNMSPGLTFKHL